MPVVIQGAELPVTASQVEQLWRETIATRDYPDEHVTVRSVSAAQIQALNQQYRRKNTPTNVLTFSYPKADTLPQSEVQHDVPLCLSVATEEASARAMPQTTYVALLLVHAFLHITGLDHEKSSQQETLTHKLEQTILTQCGFEAAAL